MKSKRKTAEKQKAKINDYEKNIMLDKLEVLVLKAAKQHASRWQGCCFALGARIGIEAVTSAFLEGVDYGLNLKGEAKISLSEALAKAIAETQNE
jgi:hypothetical protein